MHRLFALGVLLASLGLAGCGSVPPPRAEARPSVVGTVTGPSDIAVPTNADLEIRLVDFSQPRDPAIVIAETSTASPGNPPYKFRLHYNPAVIDARHDYALEARLVVAGRPRWKTEQLVPVVTKGRPIIVDLVLVPVSPGN